MPLIHLCERWTKISCCRYSGNEKKGKVYENIEKYSILRALTSIEKVMLFLLSLMVKQED